METVCTEEEEEEDAGQENAGQSILKEEFWTVVKELIFTNQRLNA